MHGHTLRRETAPVLERPLPATGAVAWIDRRRAVVAVTAPSGEVVIREIRRPSTRANALAPFLSLVADQIGDRERVVILGPDSMRVELEREYVTIHRQADRLIDVEDSPELSEGQVVDRLNQLTGFPG
jgi:hypothetical protein